MGEIGAVFLTAGLAAVVAVWGVISQRQIACRKTTIEYLARIESDDDFITARLRFIKLAKASGGLAPWADAGKEQTAEAQHINLILNNFELIAIGIQRGVLDFEFYKRWHKSTVARHWDHAAPFVMALRGRLQNPAIFCEFEELARVMKGTTPPKRNWWIGKFF
jgi:hypothetical protein